MPVKPEGAKGTKLTGLPCGRPKIIMAIKEDGQYHYHICHVNRATYASYRSNSAAIKAVRRAGIALNAS